MTNPGDVPNEAWKNLMIMAQTAAGDTHGPAQPISSSGREFLENAMSDAIGRRNDPIGQMRQLIEDLRGLKEPRLSGLDGLRLTIDTIENIVCHVDAAAYDFCRMGGLTEVIRIMNCNCDGARIEVMRLIPTLAQHNPRVQDLMLEQELIAAFMSILVAADESSDVRVKALSGISSVVRAHEPSYTRFRQLNGFVVLMDTFKTAIRNQDEKVANKTAIIFANLAHDLGYQSALDHGLPSCIIRMYGELAAGSDAASYLREYIDENIPLKSLDSENKSIIANALQRQLDYKIEHNDDDEDSLKNIEEMMSQISVHK